MGEDLFVMGLDKRKYLTLSKQYEYYIVTAVAPLGIYLVIGHPREERN